jgi:mannosyl-glycoprotein endo-beta-N-acetylglucosaminidase/stage II sporulation protein P
MAWKGSRKEFINEFGAYVHKVTSGTGILPGTLIAQLFLESSSKGIVGASKLSQDANNYFGIKCGGGWDGPRYFIETREVLNGRSVMVPACFRKYGSIKDSIQDYVLFLQENPRYKSAGVFEAKTVKEQAQALKRAGYATAPGYANLVFDVYKPYAALIDQQKTLMAGFSIKKTIGVVLLASAATIIYNKIFKK